MLTYVDYTKHMIDTEPDTSSSLKEKKDLTNYTPSLHRNNSECAARLVNDTNSTDSKTARFKEIEQKVTEIRRTKMIFKQASAFSQLQLNHP